MEALPALRKEVGLDFSKISMSSYVPVETKEKIEHLKRLDMKPALETAIRGAVSSVAANFGFRFLYAPNESMKHAYSFADEPSVYDYDIVYDLEDTPYVIDKAKAVEVRWHSHYGPKVNASILGKDGETLGSFSALKYKVTEYGGHIPLDAFSFLSPENSKNAVILDVVKAPDPILAYTVRRKSFVLQERTVKSRWFSRKPASYSYYLPIVSPFYLAVFDWE